MKPVVPERGPEGAQFFEIGLGQQEYQVLPGYRDADGLVMTEWEPSAEDRAAIAAGGRVRLWTHTFGGRFQPVQMEVTPCPR